MIPFVSMFYDFVSMLLLGVNIRMPSGSIIIFFVLFFVLVVV